MKFNLHTKKYPQEGDLQHTYSPLKNMLDENNSVVNFNTTELSLDLRNPLNIECQPSYDGTVNLIINDDKNPPRIINTRFTKIEDNRFRIINRNQTEQTNLYKKGEIDLTTRLFRNVNKIPKFDFVELNYFGQLKGGNYTFYIKYADSDYNKTDVVCESGQVSVFKGNLFDINSISGTLQDERTNKSIKLFLSNIDETFTQFYVYYTREYSDTNGFRMSESGMIVKPYKILSDSQELIINGFEQTELISSAELNVQYNYVNTVKTQAQVQNMLFFGNIENTNVDVKNLQNISYFFEVGLHQKEKSIGWIDPNTYEPIDSNVESLEYYDPKNVYYNLGYWPDEIYRLGIVYIMNDDSLSPVFNLRGCSFSKVNTESITYESNISKSSIQYKTWNKDENKWITNYIERDTFLSSEPDLANTFGVFKNPEQNKDNLIQNHEKKEVKPWYYKISFPTFEYEENGKKVNALTELERLGVKGYFFVRQKRIPMTLCQGISLGIDKESSLPALYDSTTNTYFTESFLNQTTGDLYATFQNKKVTSENRKGSALISVDACLNPTLQSNLDGSSFFLQSINSGGNLIQNSRKYSVHFDEFVEAPQQSAKCVFINSDVPYKYIDGFGFSSRAGCAESVKEFSFFGESSDEVKKNPKNYKLVRGIYSPYIAVCANLENNTLYNIKIENYSNQFMKDYFGIRRDDNSAFFAISDRFELKNSPECIDVYRGDCFANTVSIRLNRNFVDPDFPISDTIIDSKTWTKHYNGFYDTTLDDRDAELDKNLKPGDPDGNWAKINRGDLNAVPLGMWLSYKCLSNYNLGLRSEDRSYVDETALMGNPRSFYPLQDASTKSANKIAESWILNNGYSATVGQKENVTALNVPYLKDQFDNRIMFSNVQVDGDFRNSYRVFQGLSYQDIDRQYGAIVKLIPWGINLFCVFEHGLGVVPINEKALIQTTTEQPIHMYGAGVLQSQISLITPDFGSIWPESVIRTPIGIYGVDTTAKKIWRYTDRNGFETISDMKVQRFLNDNIKLNELDKYPIIALKNVKTHYNNYKGDVMFTFYNFSEGKEWNLCYNERMNKWITKYSWTPLYSENINNVFYSLDKKRAEILSIIYDNRNTTSGIRTKNNIWDPSEDTFITELKLIGNNLASSFDVNVNGVSSSYIENGKEIDLYLDATIIDITKVDNRVFLSWNKSSIQKQYPELDLPLYYKIDVTILPKTNSNNLMAFNNVICIVVDYKYNPEKYNELLGNGFYVHGRAGIFDEIDYEDENLDNQIKPTYWYNKQEPFEFEFVVNEPIGLHKIFDNLVIISNKAEPNSIEIEVIGDVYDFKKSGLLDTEFRNTTVKYDPILNQKTLLTEQECRNIEKVGRRLGNIHYKEDAWYLTVEPIRFKNNKNTEWSSARIRDKFAKIRIKYSGEDLVLITAIKTLLNLTNS